MTCVVGFIDRKNNTTYIGADSCGSNAYVKRTRVDKKVFKLVDDENALIGFTTSFRMGQLLMYAEGILDYCEQNEEDKQDEENKEIINHLTKLDFKEMVTVVIPNLANVLLEGGFATEGQDGLEGGVFLFAYKDKLYRIDSDFQVEETVEGFNTCGSGESYALGSLAATENTELSAIERIHLALQVAAKYAPGVEGPFYIMNTTSDEVVKFEN